MIVVRNGQVLKYCQKAFSIYLPASVFRYLNCI